MTLTTSVQCKPLARISVNIYILFICGYGDLIYDNTFYGDTFDSSDICEITLKINLIKFEQFFQVQPELERGTATIFANYGEGSISHMLDHWPAEIFSFICCKKESMTPTKLFCYSLLQRRKLMDDLKIKELPMWFTDRFLACCFGR